MPNSGIQGTVWVNWKAVVVSFGLKLASRPSETTQAASANPSATQRTRFGRLAGTNATTSAPSSGMNVTIVTSGRPWSAVIAAAPRSRGTSPP